MTAAMGTNKVFILDKYFNELQRYWDTEKRDATASLEDPGSKNNLKSEFGSRANDLNLRGRLQNNEEHQMTVSVAQPIQNGMVKPPLPTTGLPKYISGGQMQQQPSFHDEISTLRSVRSHFSHMTDISASLSLQQHNYSNISPVAPGPGAAVGAVPCPGVITGPPPPQHGPPSVASSCTRHTPTSFSSIQQTCPHPPPPIPSSAPPLEGAVVRSVPTRHSTPPSERQRRREKELAEEMKNSKLANIEDLIRLQGPLTEDAVVKTLQARFYNNKYQTNVGPILLSMNPYTDVGNSLTLNSTREAAKNSPALLRVAQEAVRIQGDTGYPQAIILSGGCGSGKTYAAMVLLRQLFNIAGGGQETDAFKHLAAAFSVLRSLGGAKTAVNRESSRLGHFIEVQVSEGALYRTRIHCYFLDQSRVVRPQPSEKNYHIFYQLMAGLGPEERKLLKLDSYSVRELRYLNQGDARLDKVEDIERFKEWKANLDVLGIPFMDVTRVLAAILLLGNVEFLEGNGLEVTVIGKEELKSVAGLIGVTSKQLLQGLTSKTHNVRGQLVKSSSDANMSNATRDALSKALYCRTVASIVKRANSLKRPVGALSGSMSSNESVHHEVASLHASTVGTAGSKKSSKSLAILHNAIRHATDGFIGILDMFGFEDSKPSQLEQLCINLCSETMQHFYNTHTLKTAIETCREEGIVCDVEVDYTDNAHCIDLISSLRTGLLKMLDTECAVRGCPETYVQKVKVQHKDNQRLFELQHPDITRTFGIHHYAGRVVYDTTDFLGTNRDVIPDDLVSIFHKQSCNFGFATHLFATEIKVLYSKETVPRGVTFRISPTSYELLNGDEPVSTLTQDFHTRLDNLLRTLVHAKPHFVRCIRPNETESSTEFNRSLVVQQIRSLQVLETVNLMAGGFPHRMRFKNFNSRYRMLAPIKILSRSDELAFDDCRKILDYLKDSLKEPYEDGCMIAKDWALGKKHVFLSEGTRQHLEKLRTETRNTAATLIQSVWRGLACRKRWPNLHRNLQAQLLQQRSTKTSRPRPQPILGTPPPDAIQNMTFLEKGNHHQRLPTKQVIPNGDQLVLHHSSEHNPPHTLNAPDRCDFKTIQKLCSLFGLDLERPPPVPPSRPYTVTGNRKMAYPQSRVMKNSYSDESKGGSADLMLRGGETVVVIGASNRRGHLVVEKNNHTLHVPSRFMDLRHVPCL